MKDIPNYILYGEDNSELFTDCLHIESIKARSQHHAWKFRPHQHHNLYQFFYISAGGGQALIEGQENILTDNMVIGIPPLTIHGFNFHPNTVGWVLTIPDLYLQNILKDNLLLLEHIDQKVIGHCKAEKLRQEFQFIFTSIAEEYAEMKSAHGLVLRCLATLLMTRISRLHPHVESQSGEATSQKQILLRHFQKLINLKFRQRLSVAEYAGELNITPTHLNRVCRKVLNISASELLGERSLLEAKRLLIYTSMTIAEISYELGYCDPAHFSKFFHNKIKQKPSDFRKRFI